MCGVFTNFAYHTILNKVLIINKKIYAKSKFCVYEAADSEC